MRKGCRALGGHAGSWREGLNWIDCVFDVEGGDVMMNLKGFV